MLAAAHAVTAMPHGRLDAETTANVGSIEGGVGSTNVVPGALPAAGRGPLARSRRASRPSWRGWSTPSTTAPPTAECDVDVVCERLFTGYRQKPARPAVAAAEAALRACGYEPRRIATGGGSDANALEAAGFRA